MIDLNVSLQKGADRKLEKCPKCGFQPVDGLDVCPECGFPLTEIPTDKHGDIAWEKIANLPIGAIKEVLGDQKNTVEKFQESAKEPDVESLKLKKETESSQEEEKEDEKKTSTTDQNKMQGLSDDQENDQKDHQEAALELDDEFAHLEDTNPILAQYILTHKYGKEIEKNTETDAKEELQEAEEIEKIVQKDSLTEADEAAHAENTETLIIEQPQSEDADPEAELISDMIESENDETAITLHKELTDEASSEVSNEEASEVDQLSEKLAIEPEIAPIEGIASSIPEGEAPLEELKNVDGEITTDENSAMVNSADETKLDDIQEETSPSDLDEPEVERPPAKPINDDHNERFDAVPIDKRKKRHRYLVLAALLFLAAGAGGFYYHQEKVAEAERVAKIEKENKAIQTLSNDVASFYTGDDQVFIKADKVNADTSQITLDAKKYKANKNYKSLDTKLNELTKKQTKIQEINNLFTSVAINGDKLNNDLKLKENKPVAVKIDGNDPFNQLLNKAISEASTQYDQLQAAQKAVTDLQNAKNENQEVTRQQVDDAKKQVEAVKNQDLIKTNKEVLDKINEELTAKEAEEKAKAEAEKKAEEERKAEAERTAAAQAQAQSSGTAANSDAYTWAPGVQEKVLQTCFDRGYIVQGGYYLEPVKVENGEGYYNLYATMPGPKFQNLNSSDFPLYLVTINCKTGYFRGNGNDQTIR